MWVCPKCKQKFYHTNQSHSCGRFTVNDFLSGKTETALILYKEFLNCYRKIGKYDLHPVKTRIALLTKMRFAAVNKLGKDHLDGHLILVERCEKSSLVYKIDNLNNRFFVHHFRIHDKKELDKEFISLMQLAYDVGLRKHILRNPLFARK